MKTKLTLALLPLVVFVAACGGGEKPNTTPTTVSARLPLPFTYDNDRIATTRPHSTVPPQLLPEGAKRKGGTPCPDVNLTSYDSYAVQVTTRGLSCAEAHALILDGSQREDISVAKELGVFCSHPPVNTAEHSSEIHETGTFRTWNFTSCEGSSDWLTYWTEEG